MHRYWKQRDTVLVFGVTVLVRIWILICIDNEEKAESACTWGGCCTMACKIMASVGIVKIINSETVCKWHALFRIQEKFPPLRKEK